jgi:hypothetical protein
MHTSAICGGWRKLHNEDFHNFYSLNIMRMRWTEHAACLKNSYTFLIRNLDHLEDLNIDV